MAANVTYLGNNGEPILFGARLAGSESFKDLFKEGMGLVEEAASYLDGDGRTESRELVRAHALAYASESMRLTTRLMQLASWLLLQRAVNEGEMTQNQAAAEKHKVNLVRQEKSLGADMFEKMPDRLKDLVGRSLRLQDRIIHLDKLIYTKAVDAMPQQAPAFARQLQMIEQAFCAPAS